MGTYSIDQLKATAFMHEIENYINLQIEKLGTPKYDNFAQIELNAVKRYFQKRIEELKDAA